MDWSAFPWAALIAIVVAGPWGVVLVVGLIRGYDITVTMTRGEPRPRRRRRRDADDDEG